MTIPNIITIARLIAVPVVVLLLIDGSFGWAFGLFLAAGISDGVDGAIARHVPGQASELGRLLDPVADKALLVSIFVVLAVEGHVPVWLTVLVVSRDVLIVGGVILSWGANKPVPIVPLPISKANTAAQIAYAAITLGDLGLAWRLEQFVDIMGWLVAVLTVLSAAAYLKGWLRYMQG
ncbi:CDP-alcohol phosphatidyltransferase family protein [Oryzibacter oryziterrae]|uniref:CDP-alcohol phosphatidyltransferase family protein n=1 Tax=Oryzibacter oryziterrae TaxID=2766474 RepID=UPI001F01B2A9|nr:CDP-alcohol phosphatidyltransferase family protein [Oryzibacter oryziterrae]